jgi:cytochrome P450
MIVRDRAIDAGPPWVLHAGPRFCIGTAFAMAEIMLMLAAIAQPYSLWRAPGHQAEPQGLIMLRPGNGLTMTISASACQLSCCWGQRWG